MREQQAAASRDNTRVLANGRGGGRRARLTAAPARHLALALLVVAALFPIYFVLVNALKDTLQLAQNPWAFPSVPQWSNFSAAWDTIAGPTVNSSIEVLASVAGTMLLSSLSAYAFALLRFPGRRILFALVFMLLLIPSFLTLIPLYLQIKKIGISGTYWGLILPNIAAGQALSIFVLKSSFEGIASELLEAVRIDGAGDLRIYTSLVLPLSLPTLVSVAIINVIPFWNDYVLPQLIWEGTGLQTLTMGLVTFQGSAQSHLSPNFGALMASYAIAAVPLILLFGFLMRYYIEGLSSGAVKL